MPPAVTRASCAAPHCTRAVSCPECRACQNHCSCEALPDDPAPEVAPTEDLHGPFRATLSASRYHATGSTLGHLHDLAVIRTFPEPGGTHTYRLGLTPQGLTVIVHEHPLQGRTVHGREEALDELAWLDHPALTPLEAVQFLHALTLHEQGSPADRACALAYLADRNADRLVRLRGGRSRLERLARNQPVTLSRLTRAPEPVEAEPLYGLTTQLGMCVTWT